MTVNKQIKELMKKVAPLIESVGATYKIEPEGHKHPRLYITYKGQRKFTPLAKTPHCETDTHRLKMQDIKKLLREMGAEA